MVTKIQKALQLMKLFDSYYKAKYSVDYKGNTHADKWGFADLIDDLGWDTAVEVIEYYFKTKPQSGHSRQHLSYHYHEYREAIEVKNKELENKRKILRRMKEEYES